MKKLMALLIALVAMVSVVPQAVAAAEGGNLIQNGSFEDATLESTWNVPVAPNPTTITIVKDNLAVHGEQYVKMLSGSSMNPEGSNIPVDPASTYRISFKLRGDGTTASQVELEWRVRGAYGGEKVYYTISSECKTKMAGDVHARATISRLKESYSYKMSSGTSTDWVDVSYDVPLISEHVYDMSFVIKAVSDVYIDDVQFRKIMDVPNYVLNGSFEAVQETVNERVRPTSWWLYSDSGLTSEWDSEAGNGVFRVDATNATDLKKNVVMQNFDLTSGRYMLSFKAKAINEAGKFYPSLMEIDGGTDIAGIQWDRGNPYRILAVNNNAVRIGFPVDVTNEWKTYNLYFTMPKKNDNDDAWYMQLCLPILGSIKASVACMIDDVMLVPDRTTISHSDATAAPSIDARNILMVESKEYANLQSIGIGNSLKAVAHYVPKTEGVAEKVSFMTCLYKKVGDVVRLVDLKLARGITGTDEYTATTNEETTVTYKGADAGACLTLTNEITLPDGLDNTYYAKSFIIDLETVCTEGLVNLAY